ncbi:ABC transporter permease [Neobacillus mesonae]|nr:ABC transporter permease [Neobacillus mesonae]
MHSFLTFLKIEGKLVWKSIDIFIFGICFPIILGSIFGYTLSKDGAGSGASHFELSYAAVVTIGMLATGVMGLSLTLADYRHRGILIRLQVTPVSPLQIVFAQALVQMAAALFSFIGVTLVYIFVFDFQLQGSWVSFALSYAYVLLAMYSIGILIGSIVRDTKAANVWSSVAYFSMLLFSGATIPYEVLPSYLRWGMDLFPLSHGIHLLKNTSTGASLSDSLLHVTVLGICMIVCIGIAIRYFRWK